MLQFNCKILNIINYKIVTYKLQFPDPGLTGQNSKIPKSKA